MCACFLFPFIRFSFCADEWNRIRCVTGFRFRWAGKLIHAMDSIHDAVSSIHLDFLSFYLATRPTNYNIKWFNAKTMTTHTHTHTHSRVDPISKFTTHNAKGQLVEKQNALGLVAVCCRRFCGWAPMNMEKCIKCVLRCDNSVSLHIFSTFGDGSVGGGCCIHILHAKQFSLSYTSTHDVLGQTRKLAKRNNFQNIALSDESEAAGERESERGMTIKFICKFIHKCFRGAK